MTKENIICPKCNTHNPIDSRFCKTCGLPIHLPIDEETGVSQLDETPAISFQIKDFEDRYEIIEKLGEGGMGVVFKAMDKRLNRFVALKILKEDKEASVEKSIILRTLREAQSTARMKHPNIVTIHDMEILAHPPYISMEYVDGVPLSNIIKSDKHPDFELVIDIIIQICDAMHHAHKNGIVHRDLKPSNIILHDSNKIKIMDFGIARMVYDDERTITPEGAILGTPAYIAPEIYEGGRADQISDIFSIGVIIYELITGTRPFRGESYLELRGQILNNEHSPIKDHRPETPDVFEEIITKALAKEPSKRFQNAILIKDALEKYKKSLETPTSPISNSVSKTTLWNIPHRRNLNFTGREELLDKIRNNLTSDKLISKTLALHGLGGIGKTQIVVEYTNRFEQDYSVVWWLRAEEPSVLISDYIELAEKLELPENKSENKEVTVKAVKKWLDQNEGWLLIFDNARSNKDIQPFIPEKGLGHVLITSRNPTWRGIATPITIDKMKIDDSIKLLQKWTDEKDEDAIKKLSKALGSLPLALEQAGAYIDKTGITVEEYLDLFNEHRKEVIEDTLSVATTWEISFKEINKTSSAATDLMNLCSFLAPDNIPKKLLKEGAEFYPEPLKKELSNPLSFNATIANLKNFSLVDVSGEDLTFHRLVQDVVRESLDEEKKKIWVEAVLNLINKFFNYDNEDIKTWDVSSRLLPHALVVVSQNKKIDLQSVAFGELLTKSGLYLLDLGRIFEARAFLEKALSIFENFGGEDNPKLLPVINYLGLTYWYNTEFDAAREYFSKALSLSESLYGSENPQIVKYINNLGNLYINSGDLEKALESYEKALSIVEKEYGQDNPKVAILANNLGRVFQMQGETEKAKELFERALKIDEGEFGRLHPNVAMRISNLGSVYKDMGDLPNAVAYLREAMSIDEKVYGQSHLSVANDAYMLGLALSESDDKIEARELLTRALEICKKFLGDDQPFTKEVQKDLFSFDNDTPTDDINKIVDHLLKKNWDYTRNRPLAVDYEDCYNIEPINWLYPKKKDDGSWVEKTWAMELFFKGPNGERAGKLFSAIKDDPEQSKKLDKIALKSLRKVLIDKLLDKYPQITFSINVNLTTLIDEEEWFFKFIAIFNKRLRNKKALHRVVLEIQEQPSDLLAKLKIDKDKLLLVLVFLRKSSFYYAIDDAWASDYVFQQTHDALFERISWYKMDWEYFQDKIIKNPTIIYQALLLKLREKHTTIIVEGVESPEHKNHLVEEVLKNGDAFDCIAIQSLYGVEVCL